VVEGGGVDLLRAFLADLREEDGDALPGLGVGGVVDEAQQRDEVADVLALEKLHAAGDLVGDAGAGERELHLEREEVRAVEDGDLVGETPSSSISARMRLRMNSACSRSSIAWTT
jgi:hypothetical protein